MSAREERRRHSHYHGQYLTTEKVGRLRRGLSLETGTSLLNQNAMSVYEKERLMERLRQLEKANRSMRLENLLYSRYLQRVQSSRIVQSFEQFTDGSDSIPAKGSIAKKMRLPDIVQSQLRSFSTEQQSSSKNPFWSKLAANRRESAQAVLIALVEEHKLSIAAYEVEQTQLDWERMKADAHHTLDHLEVVSRAARSDELAEEKLNQELQQTIEQLRVNLREKQSRFSPYILPAELIINRIQKRIHSRTTSIGLLHIDNTRAHMRIRQIDSMISSLDQLREKTEQIDINFVRARQDDYRERYDTLDHSFKHEKSSQYPIFRQSQQWRKAFAEEEKQRRICEKKCHLLENHLEALNEEIRLLEEEKAAIDEDNQLLTEQMTDVESVPSITEYAHIIEKLKNLQHGIEIWTKRVKIAESVLSQFHQQSKSSPVLPALKLTAAVQP